MFNHMPFLAVLLFGFINTLFGMEKENRSPQHFKKIVEKIFEQMDDKERHEYTEWDNKEIQSTIFNKIKTIRAQNLAKQKEQEVPHFISVYKDKGIEIVQEIYSEHYSCKACPKWQGTKNKQTLRSHARQTHKIYIYIKKQKNNAPISSASYYKLSKTALPNLHSTRLNQCQA